MAMQEYVLKTTYDAKMTDLDENDADFETRIAALEEQLTTLLAKPEYKLSMTAEELAAKLEAL